MRKAGGDRSQLQQLTTAHQPGRAHTHAAQRAGKAAACCPRPAAIPKPSPSQFSAGPKQCMGVLYYNYTTLPTSNCDPKSRNFWLEMVLIGLRGRGWKGRFVHGSMEGALRAWKHGRGDLWADSWPAAQRVGAKHRSKLAYAQGWHQGRLGSQPAAATKQGRLAHEPQFR